MADWGLAQTPNFGEIALGGYAAGRKIGQQQRTDAALQLYARDPAAGISAVNAVDPVLGAQLGRAAREEREAAREDKRRDIMGRIFEKQMGAPAPEASPAGATGPTEPSALVDPSQLGTRQDGVVINQEALRELYAVDADQAFALQKSVWNANKEQLEEKRRVGEQFAVAATRLKALPADQRQGELRALAPSLGLSEAQIATADLSDAGLDRYYVAGRSLADIIKDERDARTDARAEARDARSERREAAAEGRAQRAERRAQVRFSERDKDRAALAASGGGIRSDLSDLNY